MTEKITVLMLGHKSLSGKDSFYDAIKDLGFIRLSFADKLKDTVADLYGFSHDQMHGNSKDIQDTRYPNKIDAEWIESIVPGRAGPLRTKNPDFLPYLTPRRVLQLFGQQQRSLYSDIWASYIFNIKVPQLVAQGHKNFVVTDFRFKNEGEVAFKWSATTPNASLTLIKIERPGVLAKTASNDISENDLNDFTRWDMVLKNDSTLETFQDKAKRTAELFL